MLVVACGVALWVGGFVCWMDGKVNEYFLFSFFDILISPRRGENVEYCLIVSSSMNLDP